MAVDGRVGWMAAAGAGIGLLWPQLPGLGFSVPALLAACLLLAVARWRLVAVVAAAMCLAHLQAGHVLSRQLPGAQDGQVVMVSGRIEGLVVAQPGRSRFVLRTDNSPVQPPALRQRRLQLSWLDADDGPPDPQRAGLDAGQSWVLPVRVYRPRSLHNPGGYDAARQALAGRVHAQGQVVATHPSAPRLSAAGGGLQAWRADMAGRIERAVPPAQAPFIRALGLGDTGGLDPANWQALRTTGLTHLVAISGFHVGLLGIWSAWLAAGLWRLSPGLARRWPRPQAMALAALAGATAYAAAAGMELPAVRTLLMITVVVLARLARRVVGVAQCLGLALLAMVLADPLALLAAGFWLSFAGVAWLAWSLPHGPLPPLRGLLAAQAVATIGLLPLSVLLFGQASLVGPLVNLLALPWWSLVVVPLCVLGLVLEALHAGAGLWAWQLGAKAFAPSWQLVERLAGSPWALWWAPQAGLVAAGLALLGAALLLLPRGLPGRWLAPLLWLPLLWPDREPARGPDGLELHLLDVGQGLAIVVRTAGHALLYDAGPRSRSGFDAGERIVLPALHALGVRRLDGVVLSHGDADHAGGLEAVHARLPVGWVAGPAGVGVPLDRHCQAGQAWQWDGVQFAVLHPPRHFPYLGNDASCVLHIRNAHGSVLLTGDIGDVVEQRLLDLYGDGLGADVVVIAHHGSASSSLGAFVRASRAQLALVSRGRGNRFGHPAPAVVRRWQHAGAELLDTAEGGAVRVWLDADGLQLRQYRFWRQRLWHGDG